MIWIASYPRSGNTFLRTILWHCFGLKSASIYPQDLDMHLSPISKFLGCEVISTKVPNRETIANVDGQWVRKKSGWRDQISPALLDRFNAISKDILKQAGYTI